MEKNRFMKFWDGLLPFLIVYSFAQLLIIGVVTIMKGHHTMIIQNVIQTGLLLPMGMWMKVHSSKQEYQIERHHFIGMIVCIFMSAALFSMSLNQIIDALQLKNYSEEYTRVSNALFSPGVIQTTICVGFLAPVFEEVLYRGILFGALRKRFSYVASAMISSVIFGALHMNLIQFIYAASMGYIFAHLYDLTRKILVPVLAHIFANCISILMTYTGFSSWIFSKPLFSLILALLEGLIGTVFLLYFEKKLNSKKNIKSASKQKNE